jgi:hypothetical protein
MPRTTLRTWFSRPLLAPELPIAFFGFLLNFVWEMWAVRFYATIGEMRHAKAILVCTQAAFGDVVILLLAFWGTSVDAGSRGWILKPRWQEFIIYVGIGIAITMLMELLALEVWDRWSYAERMPRLPLLGTGLARLVQWVLLPVLVLGLARYHLIGAGYCAMSRTDCSVVSITGAEPK